MGKLDFRAGALLLLFATSSHCTQLGTCVASVDNNSGQQQSLAKSCYPTSLTSLTTNGDENTEDTETEAFDVFWSPKFGQNRGISIITTHSRISHFRPLPAVGADINTTPSPPFEERYSQSKGFGLFANKTIHRGDRIFAQTPMLLIDLEVYHTADDNWGKLQRNAVNYLSNDTRSKFELLYSQSTEDPVGGRIDPNAFVVDVNDVSHFAVFPEISRLNHDCRPNAAYFFDEKTLTHYVHAITDIPLGTELTISYLGPHLDHERREKKLRKVWGFACSCSLCTSAKELSSASDERLTRIYDLRNHLEENWQTSSTEAAQALVSLYTQERLHAPLAVAYKLLALTSCANGEYWNTIKYANLAIETGMLYYGFNDENVESMNRLAKDPDTEDCWLVRVK